MKPSQEIWWLVRKPLRGTIAATVLEHGTGALNIDACRVATTDRWEATGRQSPAGASYQGSVDGSLNVSVSSTHENGRWPSNVILSHTALLDPATGEVIGDACAGGCVENCPVAELDRQSGITSSSTGAVKGQCRSGGIMGTVTGNHISMSGHGDTGGSSRFFPTFRYEPKAPASERPRVNGLSHSTVTSCALMQWLCKLITPPGGTILDPFAGTGTTGQAARAEGFRAILVDNDPQAMVWIRARLDGHPRSEAPKPGRPVVEPPMDLFSDLDPDTQD